jgi:RHS repeat-associated protein
VAQSNGSGGITDIFTYGTERLTHETPEGVTQYAYDGRGSVAQELAGGAVAQTMQYSPYGEVLQGGETFKAFYGYNGEEHNPETGLQYLRARYYAPVLSSFTSMDTLGGNLHQPLTQNLYLYTGGNPVNIADPSGHGWLSNAWNAVTNVAKTVVNAVVSTAKAVVNIVTTVVKNVVNTVQTVVNNVIKPAVNTVASAVQNAASTAVTWVTNGVQSIVAAIGNSGGTSGSIPQKIGKGDTVLETTLDIDVVTLSILNRHLCSAEALKANAKKVRTAIYSAGFTNAGGDEAHKFLQSLFMVTYGGEVDNPSSGSSHGAVEYYIPSGCNSPTGTGRADMVLLNAQAGIAEVYELKPASHLNASSDSSADDAQLNGYINGLRMNGYPNATRGIAFGAVAVTSTFKSAENPGYFIVFRVYPHKPGMIYYDYVKEQEERVLQPAPEAAKEKEPAPEYQQNWTVLEQVLTVLAFITFVVLYIATYGTAPIPAWVLERVPAFAF